MQSVKDFGGLTYLESSVYSAKVPPSPSSSARSTMMTYFIDTMLVSVQMMSESAPTRSSYEGFEVKLDE